MWPVGVKIKFHKVVDARNFILRSEFQVQVHLFAQTTLYMVREVHLINMHLSMNKVGVCTNIQYTYSEKYLQNMLWRTD